MKFKARPRKIGLEYKQIINLFYKKRRAVLIDSITRRRGKGEITIIDKKQALNELQQLGGINDMDIKVSLIQELIPIGLEKVKDILQDEVTRLAGAPRKHGKINTRWGFSREVQYTY